MGWGKTTQARLIPPRIPLPCHRRSPARATTGALPEPARAPVKNRYSVESFGNLLYDYEAHRPGDGAARVSQRLPRTAAAGTRSPAMHHVTHTGIVNFIWCIADDVLRDVYVRGKYRDVILPMTVIRRLDALLEPTKEAVLGMKKQLDRGRHRQPARRALPGRRSGLLQRLALHPARPEEPRQAAAAQGRFRGLPGRLFPERPGDPRQVQVPQPDSHPDRGGHPRPPDREVPRRPHQSQPQAGRRTRTATSCCQRSTTTPWAPSSRS